LIEEAVFAIRMRPISEGSKRVLAGAFRQIGIFHQQVGETKNGGKRIADFMRCAESQAP